MDGFREIRSSIAKGELAPVYFFYGEEPYPVDQTIDAIIASIDPQTRDFNLDLFRGDEADGRTVAEKAASYPMMSERRVVILKGFELLSSKDRDAIIHYADSPQPSTCLVLTAQKVDKRQKSIQGILTRSVNCESKPLYENQAIRWIQEAIRPSAEIDPEAAQFLVQSTGTSLWHLKNEIDKLITYAWGKKRISIQDVGAVVGLSRKINPWELSDAVGQRNLTKSLEYLNAFLEEGQSPVGIVMELSRRIFLLSRLRALLEQGLSAQAAVQRLQLKPFFSRMYLDQVRHYDLSQLQRAVFTLREADLRLKTGGIPSLVLTLTIIGIVRDDLYPVFNNE